MRETRKVYKTFIFVCLVCLFSLLIVLASFKWRLHAGGDHSSYINPNILWRVTKTTWDENTLFLLGGFSYGDISSASYLLPYKLMAFLPNIWRQYIYFTLFFSLTFLVSYYYFKNYLFKQKLPALISASFYLFNLHLFSTYVNIPNQYLIIVLPLLLMVCHSIIEGNVIKILIFSFISSLFIPGAFVNVPNGLPLLLMVLLYMIFLVIKENKYRQLSKVINKCLLALGMLVLLNSWWLLSMASSLFGNAMFGVIKERTVEFFPTSSLTDAFRFLGGWSFNDYYSSTGAGIGRWMVQNPVFVFISYLLIIISSCSFLFIKKQKEIAFFILLAFLGISLSKGNLNPWGNLYMYGWKNIPGMFSFRTPQSKFMIVYVFPITCLLGYFSVGISHHFKKLTAGIINYSILGLIVILAVPFIFGGFLNRVDGGFSRSFMIKVPDYLWEFQKNDSIDKYDYRFMIYPEANGGKAYNWEAGFNTVYSEMSFFSKKANIQNNQYRYDKGDELAIETYKSINYSIQQSLGSQGDKINISKWKPALLLGILNVKYFLQENDLDWRYRQDNRSINKPSEMKRMFEILEANNIVIKRAEFGKYDQDYLSKIPNRVTDFWIDGTVLNEEQKKYLRDILYQELINRPALDLYNINKELFTPHIYIPELTSITSGSAVNFYNSLDLTDYTKTYGFYFSDKNINKDKALNLIAEIGKQSNNYWSDNIAVEYKKINPAKYQIVLHNAKGVVPIIFSDAFDNNWKLYLKSKSADKNGLLKDGNIYQLLDGYKILDGNELDQASKEEVGLFINQGWLSTLGDLKEKEIKHYTFNGGAENVDHIERYNIDFISNNYKRTIQNSNLNNGSFWETWFPLNGNSLIRHRDLYLIDENNHLNANGFVNSWLIDVSDICTNQDLKHFCRKNGDGSYDIEMVLEFKPQKVFHMSAMISSITVLGLIAFLLINTLRRKVNKTKC